LAATADQKGTLRIWDLNMGRVAREMDKIGTNNQLQMLEFLDDDRMICVETGGNATVNYILYINNFIVMTLINCFFSVVQHFYRPHYGQMPISRCGNIKIK
jgi:hypothetical protein